MKNKKKLSEKEEKQIADLIEKMEREFRAKHNWPGINSK
jgi:hypothetical protein